MSHVRSLRVLSLLALFTALASINARADEIKTVFVIAMENHNWTQPANPFTGAPQQIFKNPNAPFINSLVDGTAVVVIDGHEVNIGKQVAYATAYQRQLPAETTRTFIRPSLTTSGRKPARILASSTTTTPSESRAARTRIPTSI